MIQNATHRPSALSCQTLQSLFPSSLRNVVSLPSSSFNALSLLNHHQFNIQIKTFIPIPLHFPVSQTFSTQPHFSLSQNTSNLTALNVAPYLSPPPPHGPISFSLSHLLPLAFLFPLFPFSLFLFLRPFDSRLCFFVLTQLAISIGQFHLRFGSDADHKSEKRIHTTSQTTCTCRTIRPGGCG